MAIESAVKTDQDSGSLYMNSVLFQITAASTSSWLLEASVYIFSLVMFCIVYKYSFL